MEFTTIAQAGLRSATSSDGRGTDRVARIALPARLLAPVLQSQAAATIGSELARDLKSAIANQNELTLILPAGRANESMPARIDLGGRQLLIPPALRDALLQVLTENPATAASSTQTPATPSAATLKAAALSTALANASLPSTVALAGGVNSNAAAAMTAPAPAANDDVAAVQFARPLIEAASADPLHTAQQLRAEVERSGLFFESHLAQWARGERGADDMRAELLRVAPGLAASVADTQAMNSPQAQRVAAQLHVLQQQAISLQGPAWPGQAMALSIESEPDAEGYASAGQKVFAAKLKLELPALGQVEIELRLAGEALTTLVTSQTPALFESGLTQLSDAFAARGLQPVSLRSVARPIESATESGFEDLQ